MKPRGKWLAFYANLAFISFILMLASINYHWPDIGGCSILALAISLVRILGISIDDSLDKYDFNGRRHGADSLFEYEPGDPEYENEKYWQEK